MALEIARANLSAYGERVHFVHASYADMTDEAARLGWDGADAILLDLGVSSMQLDVPERGFAFRSEGPLDMRFDAGGSRPTAADLVNTLDERDLADLFFRYGEERDSRRLARAVVRERPYTTTRELAAVIERAAPRRHDDKIHPATRVFQALRIAVNDELAVVEQRCRRRLICCARADASPSSAFTVLKTASSKMLSGWRAPTASARRRRRSASAGIMPAFGWSTASRSWRTKPKSRRTRAAAAPSCELWRSWINELNGWNIRSTARAGDRSGRRSRW